VQLVYARNREGNFGDDLNEVIWPFIFPALLETEKPGVGLVGIGTIIGMPVAGLDELHVFSSGFGYDALSNWSGKKIVFWCVRGRLSAAALGLSETTAITDGAYLSPFVQTLPQARSDNPGGTVVIPHVDSVRLGGWGRACADAGFTLLDPRGRPQDVIAAISGAALVLTESLHGAILADAYGVPWVPFGSSKNFSTVKWADWLSSLEVRPVVSSITPPTPRIPARFGRHRGQLGAEVVRIMNTALLGGTPNLSNGSHRNNMIRRLKILVAELPGAGELWGSTPARTAEALYRLSRLEPTLSSREKISSLQSQLVEKLRELSLNVGVTLNPVFT
jgi:succinoglycan biosynthesis protein ExoV